MPVTTPSARSAPPVVRTRLSTRAYWVGATSIVAATVGAVIWIVLAWFAFARHVDGFQRTTIPGTATVRVDAPSTRVLYYEGPRGTRPPTAADVTVTSPDGFAVPVRPYVRDVRYDVPADADRVGHALASFHADASGAYGVRVATTASGGTLAIGDDVANRTLPHVLGAGALFLAGAGSGLTLILVTRSRRSAARLERSSR
jgi:hypothetical protein